MRPVRNIDIRLASKVIKVAPDTVSVYYRVRGELFLLQSQEIFVFEGFFGLLDHILSSLRGSVAIDIIFDNQFCQKENLQRSFGTGWDVHDSADFVDVKINGFFETSTFRLTVLKDIVSKVAACVKNNDIEHGRLFYACPGNGFRYSVFSQLSTVVAITDVAKSVMLNYCVSLPRFTDSLDPLEAPLLKMAAVDNLAPAGPAPVASVAGKAINVRPKFNMPEIRDYVETQCLQPVKLCLLLDETVNTAIAASAYLARDLTPDTTVAEIGFWRKKLKSNFQKYSPVTHIHEFMYAPLTTIDVKDFKIFIGSISRQTVDRPLVVVLGEDMLDHLNTSLMGLFSDLAPYQFIVFGQSDHALRNKWDSISKFTKNATTSMVNLAQNSASIDLGEGNEITTFQSFSLTPIVKQKLRLAQKNNTTYDILRQISAQVFPYPTSV